MPPLTTLHLAHLPPTLTIHIALYTHLTNASYLRSLLFSPPNHPTTPAHLNSPTHPPFTFALIDATTLLSTTHLLSAIYRACTDHLLHRLRSRNLHSEIVFSLGANNNIAQSLRGFGIGEGTREVVVVRVVEGEGGEDGGSGMGGRGRMESGDIERELDAVVEGRGVELCDEAVREVSDLGKIRKLYKLPVGGEKAKRKKGGKDAAEEGVGDIEVRKEKEEGWERRELEVTVLGLMALRGAV